MNVLVLGGSGILSKDFVTKMLDMGDEVYVVNRGRRKEFLDKRVHLIIGDVRSESVEMLRNKTIQSFVYDVVVDFLSFEVDHLEKHLAVVEGKFRQYIFISSATVHKKDNEECIITENTPIGNDKWEYAKKKSECEDYLKKKDINYTIIRPYVTYGNSRIPFPIIPDGYHYTLLARIKAHKPVVMYNEGEAICTLTHTKDFAEILYKVMLNERTYKEDYIITSNARQSWREVYYLLCNILNVEPNDASVGRDEIRQYLPEYLEILEGDKGTNMLFDNSKILQVIGGYDFLITLEQGLQETIEFFEKNAYMQGIDYKWDGKVDYLLKMTKGIKLCCLKENAGSHSNSKIYYYVMCCLPLRILFEVCRKIKKKLLK